MPKVTEPKGTGYHYLYLRQPPGVGCQPDGWVHRESWFPCKRADGWLCFGIVVYAEKLAPELVDRYGLRPDSRRPIWPYETDKKIRQVYRRVCAACERATAKGREYVGFQRLRAGGFRLVATDDSHGGRSSYNYWSADAPYDHWSPDTPTHTWALNALYRLQEEGFIPRDWPLDEWGDANFAT